MTLEEEFEFWSPESLKITEEAFESQVKDIVEWHKDCGTSFTISSPETTESVTELKQNGTTVYGLDIGMQVPTVMVVANITSEEPLGYSLEILDLRSIG